MPNYPGPYELEFMVSMGAALPARSHAIRINVAVVGSPSVGDALSAITLQKQGGGTGTAQAIADQFWSFIRLAYASTCTCEGVTLWKYVPNTHAKDFFAAGAVASPTGATGTAQVAHQTTLSFRSANGSVLKLVLLESNQSGNTSLVLVPNAAGTTTQRIAAYMLSADSAALARDDSYLVAALKDSRGENERVWRKVYRGT